MLASLQKLLHMNELGQADGEKKKKKNRKKVASMQRLNINAKTTATHRICA